MANVGSADRKTDDFECPVCLATQATAERQLRGFALYKCCDCTMVYVWPRPTREASRESYSEGLRGACDQEEAGEDARALMHHYDLEHTAVVQQALGARLARIASGRTIKRMLDFGCGSGHLLGLAGKVLGCETYGVELNPIGRAGAQRFGFQLHEGRLEDLQPPENGFDLIYSGQVFEHLPDPREEMQVLSGMLAENGVLYVEVPNYASLSIRLSRDNFLNNTPPGHLNYFTPTSLSRLLNAAGLRVLRCRTTGLNHRALRGRDIPSATEQSLDGQTPTATSTLAPSRSASLSSAAKLKLRALAVLDGMLSVPAWGMQVEVVGTKVIPLRQGSDQRASVRSLPGAGAAGS